MKQIDVEKTSLLEKDTSDLSTLHGLLMLGNKYSTLSREEKDALAVQAQHGDKPAKEKLMIAHINMVAQVAIKKYKQMYTVPINVSLEDLIMAGCVGLCEAIDRFNPHGTESASFTTYAMYFVVKAVNQAYLEARPIKITEHIMERTIIMKKTCDQLHSILKRFPTEKEVYDYCDGEYSMEVITETMDLIRNTGVISLYEKFESSSSTGGEEEAAIIDMISDAEEKLPEDIAWENYRRHIIDKALGRLPKREEVVIRCLFGLNDNKRVYTLHDTGKKLVELGLAEGLTLPVNRETVSNIRRAALKKLKIDLADSGVRLE